jgi:trigger factor
MQVTETVSEGLKREFQVTVPAADLETRMSGRLAELKDRVKLPGFRPGKVPVTHLRKVYGRSVMAETVEAVIRELNAQIVEERGLRLAREPKVTIPNEETEVDRVISGKADLAYTLSFEVLPAIALADFGTIKLEKLVAEVADSEVDDALKQIAEQNKPYAAKAEGAKVENGDRVVIDFVGRVDGTEFPGGTGTDVAVTVGSSQFIPGFEEQLVGLGVGETKVVKVTFPETYPTETLAGKAAEFDVTAKSIEAAQEVTIDDEFAKSLGLESLAKVKDAVKDRIAREHASMSRQKLKRKLLDQLDALHKFTPPPTLVEDEFNSIWTTIEGDLKRQNRTFADEGTTEEKAREEYRAIAERRVRLGLLLAEIGDKNSIKVSDEEIQRAIVERARQIPGREQEVWDYYRKNPQAVAGIRAPIYEEKVVDFLLELAKVTDKTVTKEELFKEDEEETAKA